MSNVIREFRQRHNLTQAGLAKALGLNIMYFSAYETGRLKVSDKLLERILEKFDDPILSGMVCNYEGNIEGLRRTLCLSQKQLAEELGCSQQTLSEYENGRRRIPSKVGRRLKEKQDGIGEESSDHSVEEENIDIREFRIESGLSQATFAESIGVSEKTVSEIENGKKKLTITVMRKIRDRYGSLLTTNSQPLSDFLQSQNILISDRTDHGQTVDCGDIDGETLKSLRLKLGMRQSEFAMSIGRNHVSLSAYENGRRRIPERVKQLILEKYGSVLTTPAVEIDLRKLRKRMRMTQKELARALDISQQCVLDYETGKRNISVKVMGRIKKMILNPCDDASR